MRLFTDFLTRRDNPEKMDLAFLLLAFSVPFFLFLGRVPLIEPDEGRYAEIPREMLELGDFITPHLNYVKYLEKPPLHYWLSAMSFKLFGINEFAARFPGALMGLLTVLITYHAGRKVFGRRAGLLSAMILGTSPGFVGGARIDITDMTLTCTLSAALLFFIIAVRENGARKGLYYHLFYLFSALAVLAKGLIGVVFPGAIIFLYLLFTGNWRTIREMRLATGIPLFLAVSAPWFIMVSLKNPEFPHFFFIREHFERFTTTVHHRKKSLWFFLPVLMVATVPWSFLIPASLRGIWRERLSVEGKARLFLAIWGIFIFLFFSLSNSQLEPYILPVIPALALLMGSLYALFPEEPPRGWNAQFGAVSILLVAGGVGLATYPHLAARPGLAPLGAAILGSILILEGIITFSSLGAATVRSFTWLILCSYLAASITPHLVMEGMAKRRSLKEMGRIVSEKAHGDAMIASFGLLQGLPFYAGRRVVVVGDPGEAEFGSRQGDNSAWFIDRWRFLSQWESPRQVFAVLSRKELDEFRTGLRNIPIFLAEGGKKLLITNH